MTERNEPTSKKLPIIQVRSLGGEVIEVTPLSASFSANRDIESGPTMEPHHMENDASDPPPPHPPLRHNLRRSFRLAARGSLETLPTWIILLTMMDAYPFPQLDDLSWPKVLKLMLWYAFSLVVAMVAGAVIVGVVVACGGRWPGWLRDPEEEDEGKGVEEGGDVESDARATGDQSGRGQQGGTAVDEGVVWRDGEVR